MRGADIISVLSDKSLVNMADVNSIMAELALQWLSSNRKLLKD